MPLFLTLRDDEGNALVTAMLPPGGQDDRSFRPIIASNADPYMDHADAIRALGQDFGLTLREAAASLPPRLTRGTGGSGVG